MAGNVGYAYASTGNDGVSRQVFFQALTDPATAEVYTPGEAPLFAAPVSVPAQPWKSDDSVGHLAGYALNVPDGSLIDGAVVTITGPEDRVLTSDVTGFFGAVGLPPGDYTLRASHEGIVAPGRTVTVVGGQVLTSEVTLGPPVFVVAEVERLEGSVRVLLCWPSQADHSYGLESSPDAGSWTPLSSGIPADPDLWNHYEDMLPAGAPRRFYRLIDTPP